MNLKLMEQWLWPERMKYKILTLTSGGYRYKLKIFYARSFFFVGVRVWDHIPTRLTTSKMCFFYCKPNLIFDGVTNVKSN